MHLFHHTIHVSIHLTPQYCFSRRENCPIQCFRAPHARQRNRGRRGHPGIHISPLQPDDAVKPAQVIGANGIAGGNGNTFGSLTEMGQPRSCSVKSQEPFQGTRLSPRWFPCSLRRYNNSEVHPLRQSVPCGSSTPPASPAWRRQRLFHRCQCIRQRGHCLARNRPSSQWRFSSKLTVSLKCMCSTKS